MTAGESSSRTWVWVLVGGLLLLGVTAALEGPLIGGALHTTLLGAGGLAVVFGSCEAMIKAVEGIAARVGMNAFVAGTLAGLASNIPELVMLGFVLAAAPRVGFMVCALTLHVGVAAFGIYSGLLPRNREGRAKLPEPLVKLSTDLYVCAAAVFFTTGGLMVLLAAFTPAAKRVPAFGAADLYVLAGALLVVEAVALVRMVRLFSPERVVAAGHVAQDGAAEQWAAASSGSEGAAREPAGAAAAPGVLAIVLYGLLGLATSVIGGHAVGEFAEVLVGALGRAGYSEMVGALVLSVFSAAGAFVMAATAHIKGLHDIAMANISSSITQVPFVVLPVAMILLAALGQLGVIPTLAGGGILPVDLHTASVLLLGFPAMVILWTAVQDDGAVSWVETVTMSAIFGIIIYFLAAHG